MRRRKRRGKIYDRSSRREFPCKTYNEEGNLIKTETPSEARMGLHPYWNYLIEKMISEDKQFTAKKLPWKPSKN